MTNLGMSGGNEAEIDGDGRIVVVGTSQNHSGLLSTVLRYLPDGNLDPTFSNDGIRRIRIGTFAAFRSLAVEPSGAVALLGDLKARHSNRPRLSVMQLREDGTNDSTFGGRGRVRILRRASARSGDIVTTPGGKLIVAASCRCPVRGKSQAVMVVLRLGASGRLDRSFGADGLTRVGFDLAAGPGGVADLAIDPADGILAVGTGAGAGSKDFETRRYLP